MTVGRSKSRLGVGVVGLGMVAATHGRALGELADSVDVVGVFSPSQARRKQFGATFGFPLATSVEALIADERVDAVLCLTPPNARVEIARLCVDAGKHALMEKPLERTAQAATGIVEAFEAANLKLGVVLQYRFRESAQRLKRIVSSQTFGALASAHANVPWWRPQSYYDGAGRGSYERDGGGVMITQALHLLDLMLWLCGGVTRVQASFRQTSVHRMESEDFVVAGLDFASGAVGSVVATTADYPGFPETITLNFERGSARLEGGHLTAWPHDRPTEQWGDNAGTGGGADPMAFPHAWHRAVIADFVAAVREDRPPMTTGRDSLQVLCLIEAMQRSSSEGRAVEF
jgi:UDP-N-acetyl-2-amino-2-deoxyglucuronate dehydrogenase